MEESTNTAGDARAPLALVSVYDKRGLEGFARGIVALGYELLSTGGTARALRAAGLAVKDVSEHTGSAELFEGRVKTLHPRVHAGILARRDRADDMADLGAHGIPAIDLVCVNLYPFEAAVDAGERDPATLRELIDVGGPTMVRAAAKSWPWVSVVTDPSDYEEVLAALGAAGASAAALAPLRRRLAQRAFARTAAYDAAIAAALEVEAAQAEACAQASADAAAPAAAPAAPAPEPPAAASSALPLPERLTLGLVRAAALRYGENPHQAGALYRVAGLASADLGAPCVHSGKALSYNNLLDLDAALELVRDLVPLAPAGGAAACVVKHASPCGAALGTTGAEAYASAHAGDPLSAFGGIACVLPRVDRACALALTEDGMFLECVVSGGFDDDALEVLQTRPRWGASVRLVTCAGAGLSAAGLTARLASALALRTIAGGVLVQDKDRASPAALALAPQTTRRPSAAEEQDLRFALVCAKHARSNAIAVARAGRLLGLGGGQPSRVGAAALALGHAGEASQGAVLASDGFFPFPDTIERAAAAGIACVIAPGGSRRDAEVVAAAERLGLALVFTPARHFRH